MDLSIVSTLYSSEPHLEEFHSRVSAVARQVTGDYEIVLVNDGSPDRALAVALELQSSDPRVVVVDLSRNFGHHKAMMTGLSHARGELVFLIDCDLEEPPELLQRFWPVYHDSPGCDVVYGVQTRRKGRLFERISGAFYYGLINLLSEISIPRNFLTVRLMSRRYVRSLLRHREREMVFAALTELAGFSKVGVPVEKHSKGSSTYSVGRKLAILVNTITSASVRPLWIVFYSGTAITVLSGVFIGRQILLYFRQNILEGWTSLIVSVWFLGGLNLMALGILGIYLSKVYQEAKRRPYSVVRQIYRAGSTAGGRESVSGRPGSGGRGRAAESGS